MKKYILLCIIAVLLVSCIGKKKDSSENASSIQQEEEQSDLNVPVNAEQMKDFLYENDESIRRFNQEITFIGKANFGILGGGNWIARFNDRYMSVYSIDGNKIIRQYSLGSFNLEDHSIFNIMQDIPGKRIGNSTSSIYDFNGDGIDEIFSYGFGGNGNFASIRGYDAEKDGLVLYCNIPFEIIDKEQGPAPVEFLTYNGVYGFKVYFMALDVPGGTGYIPEPIPNNNKWIFFTWDAEQRKYVEMGEVVE